jgi:large subunit ribosomal protein L18
MGASSRNQTRKRRAGRIRKKIVGSPAKPRLSVFKSARHIYAQVIDDLGGRTLTSVSTLSASFRERGGQGGGDVEAARLVGELVGEAVKNLSVEAIAFDRNGYQYHGRIAALADAVRKQGVRF